MATATEPLLGASRYEQLIKALADENHASIEHVRELFELEHTRLQAQARVKTYLTVIATRLVRNSLHAARIPHS